MAPLDPPYPRHGVDLPAAAARLRARKRLKSVRRGRPSNGRAEGGTLTMLLAVRTSLLTVGAVYLVAWALGLLG